MASSAGSCVCLVFVTRYSVFEDVLCSLLVTCLQDAELLSGKLKILRRSQYQQELCLASLVGVVEHLHYANIQCLAMVGTIVHVHGVSPCC